MSGLESWPKHYFTVWHDRYRQSQKSQIDRTHRYEQQPKDVGGKGGEKEARGQKSKEAPESWDDGMSANSSTNPSAHVAAFEA